jgi:hypothetical protein
MQIKISNFLKRNFKLGTRWWITSVALATQETDQEDRSSKLASGKEFVRLLTQRNPSQKCGVAQGVGSEFKFQYHKKRKKI